MKNNYKEYDTLTLYVKKNKLDEIIKHYQVFGWELALKSENKRYEDIIDLTFTRPHKIKNKDELQLQQVYMEEKLNKMAKYERDKHLKSTSFGVSFGLVAFVFLVMGILIWLNVDSVFGIVSGIAIFIIGLLLIIFEIKLIVNIFKTENFIYEQKRIELEAQISTITKKVKELVGDYGQD